VLPAVSGESIMIHIVAILTAKMGHRGSLLAALQSVVPAVRAEPGCLEYQPVVDMDQSPVKFGADTLVVIEKWADQEALDGHNEGAPLAEFREKSKHLLAQADVYLLQGV
jgi:quinol monooxygenase YgiN